MDEIIKQCKAGIHLEINDHRNSYLPIKDAIQEINDLHSEEEEKEIDDELAERMIKEDMLISLQFYPNTPIGFYKVYGTSLEEVVKKAKECLLNN